MTLNTALVTRVRSNINEPSAEVSSPLRSDGEILQWLQDGQLDYVHRVPKEHFPELISTQTFSGNSVTIPADYLFFYSCTINHTISGTITGKDECFVIKPGENYLIDNYPTVLGAWAQVAGAAINFGPNCISGTLSYVKVPPNISSGSVTFGMSIEHESAIVEFGSAMALLKVNDADSESHMALYEKAIASKGGQKQEAEEVERA
jgi:hypothetical protein